METFQMFQNTEILDSWPSRSRNAVSRLGIVFDCKQGYSDIFEDLPDCFKTGISSTTSSLRKIWRVWSSGGKEKHPEFPPSPSRWSNMAGFEHPNNWFLQRDGFYLCSQALWFPNIRNLQSTDPFQALARISQIPKRHVWTRNRSPFQLQIDLAPKSRYWPPWMSRLRFFVCSIDYIKWTKRAPNFTTPRLHLIAFLGIRSDGSTVTNLTYD